MSRSVLFTIIPAIFSLERDTVSTKLFVFVAVTALVTPCVADGAQNCIAAGDCSGEHAGEQCCNGKCTTTESCLQGNECSSNDNCFTSHVCCNSRCVANWDCLEQSCSLNEDCQRNETCHYGFCKRNNECVDVLMVLFLCLMLLTLVAFCSLACEKTTSNKRWCSCLDFLCEMTSNPRSAILTERTLDSNQKKLNTGFLSSFPPKVKPAQFYVPRRDEQQHIGSEKLDKETVGAKKSMPWYGSTCETV